MGRFHFLNITKTKFRQKMKDNLDELMTTNQNLVDEFQNHPYVKTSSKQRGGVLPMAALILGLAFSTPENASAATDRTYPAEKAAISIENKLGIRLQGNEESEFFKIRNLISKEDYNNIIRESNTTLRTLMMIGARMTRSSLYKESLKKDYDRLVDNFNAVASGKAKYSLNLSLAKLSNKGYFANNSDDLINHYAQASNTIPRMTEVVKEINKAYPAGQERAWVFSKLYKKMAELKNNEIAIQYAKLSADNGALDPEIWVSGTNVLKTRQEMITFLDKGIKYLKENGKDATNLHYIKGKIYRDNKNYGWAAIEYAKAKENGKVTYLIKKDAMNQLSPVSENRKFLEEYCRNNNIPIPSK